MNTYISNRVLCLTLSISFFWAIVGCGGEDGYRDISDYYFPVDDMEEGYVYLYDVYEGLPYTKDVWFYKKVEDEEEGKVFLSAQQYDAGFNVVQFQLQSITASGALLDQNVFYSTSEDGRAVPNESRIEEDNHFPFLVKDSLGVFLSSLVFWDIRDSTEITLVRNRRFLRDTVVDLWGSNTPAIVMGVREAYDYNKEGVLTVESNGIEIYANNIGLIYSRKMIQDSFEVSFGLDTFYYMDNFLEAIELQH